MTTQRQPENKQYIIDALDQAISAAFNENFRILAQGKTEDEIRAVFSQRITQALPTPQNPQPPAPDNAPPDSEPSNDQAAALIYAVTYHLQHINLTYSLIQTLLNHQPALTSTGRLHIIDLNPQALAMQFAITLTIADALQNGQNIASVTIDHANADTPLPLLGETIWKEFTAIIQSEISKQNRQFQWLYRACNLINPNPQNDLSQIQKNPDADTWLNLIYAAHQTQQPPLPPNLDQLLAKIKPDAAFLTSYGNHNGVTHNPTPEKISPFAPNEYNTSLLTGKPQEPRQLAIPNRLGRYYAEKVTNLNKLFRLINNRQISPRTETAIMNWPWDTTSLICIAKPAPTTPTVQPVPSVQPASTATPSTPAAPAVQPAPTAAPHSPQTPTIPAAPKPPKTETPTQPDPQTPTPAPYAIGDRVQTPIGAGQIWRIRKSRADVRLDNGITTTLAVADLTPAQQ